MNKTWILIPVLLSGCVSQGKYDELQRQHDETRKNLAASNQKSEDLAAALAAEEQKSSQLGDRIAQLEADLAAANKSQAALAQDKAQLLKDRSALAASVEDMKQALAEAARRKAEADARIAEYRGLIARFKPLIDAGKLRVKIVDGRMVVELPTDVLFASGSAKLSKEGQQAIAEIAQVLAGIADRDFQVEGHTDNVPIATAQYPSNWELSSARALTVTRTMVDAGMAPERLSAAGYGEFKPASANDTKEGRAANRRIEIVVVPDLSSLPGFEELQEAAGET